MFITYRSGNSVQTFTECSPEDMYRRVRSFAGAGRTVNHDIGTFEQAIEKLETLVGVSILREPVFDASFFTDAAKKYVYIYPEEEKDIYYRNMLEGFFTYGCSDLPYDESGYPQFYAYFYTGYAWPYNRHSAQMRGAFVPSTTDMQVEFENRGLNVFTSPDKDYEIGFSQRSFYSAFLPDEVLKKPFRELVEIVEGLSSRVQVYVCSSPLEAYKRTKLCTGAKDYYTDDSTPGKVIVVHKTGADRRVTVEKDAEIRKRKSSVRYSRIKEWRSGVTRCLRTDSGSSSVFRDDTCSAVRAVTGGNTGALPTWPPCVLLQGCGDTLECEYLRDLVVLRALLRKAGKWGWFKKELGSSFRTAMLNLCSNENLGWLSKTYPETHGAIMRADCLHDIMTVLGVGISSWPAEERKNMERLLDGYTISEYRKVFGKPTEEDMRRLIL